MPSQPSSSALPDLLYASVEELSAGLNSSCFTSLDLVTSYLARIQEVNPTLKTIIEINCYAALDAKRLDDERKQGSVRGPLHGLPILVKDTMATARPDQTYMNTTAGSYALLGSVPSGDSTVVGKLKEAGALILGKANLTEWGNFRCDRDSDGGWSARGGNNIGAYYEAQCPAGSSSGSGVAPSVGLAPIAIGGETCGSIVGPAARNNVVGVKPTPGLVSRHLVVPISSTKDTIGPMAGDVATCAAVLQVISGKDDQDSLTDNIPFETVPDYLGACNKEALNGARIGVPTSYIEAICNNKGVFLHQAEVDNFNSVLSAFEASGTAVIRDVKFKEDFVNITQATDDDTVEEAEFAEALARYLEQLTHNPAGIKNIHDLIKFTARCPAEEAVERNMGIWDKVVERNLNTSSPEYKEAIKRNTYIGGEGSLLGAMEEHDLDALIVPTNCAWSIAALAGYPIITVPAGFSSPNAELVSNKRGTYNTSGPNKPYGIAFIGRRFSEEKLIGLAYAFEQATQIRRKVQPLPHCTPSTQLKDGMTRQ